MMRLKSSNSLCPFAYLKFKALPTRPSRNAFENYCREICSDEKSITKKQGPFFMPRGAAPPRFSLRLTQVWHPTPLFVFGPG